jgi:hypothetical protein
VSRGVRNRTLATTESLTAGLTVLLHEFCAKRPRGLSGPMRVSADELAVDAPTDEPGRAAAGSPNGASAYLSIHAPLRASFNARMATTQ